MKEVLQKMKEIDNTISKAVKELHTTFPEYGFKINSMSAIFMFTVQTESENTETLVTPQYILKYPVGFDIELFKTVVDKY